MIRTTVTRETEWDDVERAKMQGLALYESQICKCGLHQSIADTDPDLEIVLPVCPVCAGLELQTRVLHAEDDRITAAHGDKPKPGIPRPSDGRRIELKFRSPVSLEDLAE